MKISLYVCVNIKTKDWKFRFLNLKNSIVSECLHNISRAHILKHKRCFNVKFAPFYFHVKAKILADFQICISVPLTSYFLLKTKQLKRKYDTGLVLLLTLYQLSIFCFFSRDIFVVPVLWLYFSLIIFISLIITVKPNMLTYVHHSRFIHANICVIHKL